MDEIDARFGHESELPRVQLESLRWLVDIAQRAGAKRLIVNESFVTDELQELSLRSLKRMINQLKEEIARFESHAMHGSAG